MKKTKLLFIATLTTICFTSIYFITNQNNSDQVALAAANTTAIQKTLEKTDSTKNPVETTVKNETNDTTNPTKEIPTQLTADEAVASQQNPITIDEAYQGTWTSIDGTQTIVGNEFGYSFEGAPVSWLIRYAKTDDAIVFGDTNYFTYTATLTSDNHLVITKTDGSQTIEFTR